MRRHLPLLPLLLLVACQSSDEVRPVSRVAGADEVAAMEPAAALDALKAGNRRFVAAAPVARDWKAMAEDSAAGAHPFAAVLTTMDARVPVGRAFDVGIGDLVAVRVPGPLLTADSVAALEASARGGAKVLVVMTHSDCDEIHAACGDRRPGAVLGLQGALEGAIAATPKDAAARVAMDPVFDELSFADAVAVQHARRTLDELRRGSAELRAMEQGGFVKIVAAYYDIGTGAVVWLP